MGLLLLVILILLIFGAGAFLAVSLIGLLLTLFVAGLVGWAADLLIPGGALPGGWVGAVLTGILGGLVGAWLFGALRIHDPGFSLFGIDLIPAFIGAVAVALLAQLFVGRRRLV